MTQLIRWGLWLLAAVAAVEVVVVLLAFLLLEKHQWRVRRWVAVVGAVSSSLYLATLFAVSM